MTGSGFGKSDVGFRVHKRSLEPTTMALGVDQTPIDRFFVCNVDDAPAVDADSWSLTIAGDAAGRTVTVSLSDLQALPQYDVDAWLECAGNGRRLFEFVGGRAPSKLEADTQWILGAMGMASWRGPRLADVLALAEPAAAAAWVSPRGLDHDNAEGEAPRMCMPLDKARDPDTLIALEMNGQLLTAAHGAPARLLVPGWIGAYSMKWVEQIDIAVEWVPSWRNDIYYRHRDPDGTDRGPATIHPVKSSLALEWGEVVVSGPLDVLGYARSGAGSVTAVDWSLDGGPWHDAELLELPGRWSWTPFRLRAELTPGLHQIRTRATDSTGTTQPDSVSYNPSTILWNAVTPHDVYAE
ncbi:MAG: molybdopterin-dependent oxidoreductase [Acidimicrobiales bacterium]|nr:molybdopterin-dependent oxidoreductase [Acidimicrobiales bacterium]